MGSTFFFRTKKKKNNKNQTCFLYFPLFSYSSCFLEQKYVFKIDNQTNPNMTFGLFLSRFLKLFFVMKNTNNTTNLFNPHFLC